MSLPCSPSLSAWNWSILLLFDGNKEGVFIAQKLFIAPSLQILISSTNDLTSQLSGGQRDLRPLVRRDGGGECVWVHAYV